MTAIVSAAGTNAWNTNGAWVGAVQPTNADDVTITAGTTVSLPTGTTVSCRSCTVAATGTLKWDTTTSILAIGDGTAGLGNVAFSNAGTLTLTGIGTINFIWAGGAPGAAQTVTSGGQTMPNMVYGSSGAGSANGSWQFSDNITSTSATITLTAGTLDMNGKTVSCNTFSSSNTNTRTVTLGAANITADRTAGTAWDMANATSLTITANTATITFTKNTTMNLSNVNLNGASVVMGAAAAQQLIHTGATLANLTRTGTAVKTDTLIISSGVTLTITGTFTLNSNATTTNRVLLQSSTLGTAATISAATFTATNVSDFRDITGAGAATWTVGASGATALGDCGGNSGITFTTPATQTYDGTAGNWSTAARWTSRVPLPQDDVLFNTGSGNVAGDMPRWGKNLNFSGWTGTLTNAGAGNTVYGSLTFAAGTGVTISNIITFEGRSSYTITSAGKSFDAVTIAAVGGTYTLQDAAISTAGSFIVSNGTFDAAGFSLTVLNFASTGTPTRTVTLGASTVSLTNTNGATLWNVAATGLTLNAGTSNIVISTTSANTRILTLAGFNYNTVTYNVAGSSGTLTLGAATYIAKVDMDISSSGTARTLNWNTGSSYTIGDLHLKGSSGNVVSLKTSSAGTAVTLALLGPVSTNDWLDVRDITNVIPYKFYAGANSVSTGGGNTNVLLADKVTQPAIWNAANSASSGTGPLTATLSGGLTATAGNILLAVWTASNTSVSGLSAPSGYTLIDNNTVANTPQAYMWYKVAVGGETAATVSTSSSHTIISLSLMELGSFTGSGTLDVFAHTDSGASVTSQASASVTNTASPAIVVAGFSASASAGNFVSITNSWQEQRVTQNTSAHYFALPLTSTGAQTTTYTWTSSRTSANVAVIFKGVVASTGHNLLLLGAGT